MVLLELLVLFATSGPPCDYEEIVLKQKEIYTSLIS